MQRAGGRAVLIVPEQYTFETERTLSDALGGLLGVQVLSFERLSERVLLLSGQQTPFLSAQGCRMVVKRAALGQRERLRALGGAAGQAGFADAMRELFSDLKRSGLRPDDLSVAAEKLEDHAALSDKLYDIAALYRDTEDYLAGRYLTGDDAMDAARALIPFSFIRDIPVFIDDVDRPNAQLYALMQALLTTASGVTVALRVDRGGPPDAEVFAPDAMIFERLKELAVSLGMPVSVTDCMPAAGRGASAVEHLERNLFACPARPYPNLPEGVALYGASDRVREVNALSEAVLAAAHRGLRWREMAVIVSDMDAYAPLVERAFHQREIPLFLDRKRPLTGHAAADALLSALRAVSGGYAAADVLRLCKTGYAGAEAADAEELELYLRRRGLFGAALKKPFTGENVPEGAERARAAVMDGLLSFHEDFTGQTVAGRVRALVGYLTSIDLAGRLSAQAEALGAAGRISLMEEHAQVWSMMMELLGQLEHVLGDARVSGRAFTALVEEGLSGCAIGVIPDAADAVLLGDYARSKCRSVRALFVAGVNEGLLPAARGDDAIINDAELKLMRGAGLSVWNSTEQRAAMDRLDIYTAFSKATESIFISYAFMGEDGELSPSPLVESLRAIFPALPLRSDLDSGDTLPLSRADGLYMLSHDLSALRAGASAPARLPSLIRIFREDESDSPLARRLLAAASARGGAESLPAEDARMLYAGAHTLSASRLEQFNACPFKHFIRYGLKAADEKTYEEKAVDIGSFYHAALESFVRTVQERSLDWHALDDAAVDALMDELLPAVIATHNEGIFLTSPRHRAALFLLVQTVQTGARAIARQIRAGGFLPLGAECGFGPNEAFPPLPIETEAGEEAYLTGVIDRIDTAGLENTRYYRVVDYKTGARSFDFGELIDGLSLQLPLYLAAAAQAGQGRAGLYYMTLQTPVPDDGEDPAQAAADAFRLRGLTLSEPRVLLASGAESGAGVLEGVQGDGERFTGNIATGEQFGVLLGRALEVARQSLAGIRGGRIEARPMDKACEHCDYQSVCRFDPALPGCLARRRRRIGREAFFAEGGGL